MTLTLPLEAPPMPTDSPQRLHRSFTVTEEKHLANGVLPALRRRPNRATLGADNRFQVVGAGESPKGLPPIIQATWWIAPIPAHDGLGLPQLGLLISDDTLQASRFDAAEGDWYDLLRVVRDTQIEVLYRIRDHPDGWFAQRNNEAGGAPDAALWIVRNAIRAEHIYGLVNP